MPRPLSAAARRARDYLSDCLSKGLIKESLWSESNALVEFLSHKSRPEDKEKVDDMYDSENRAPEGVVSSVFPASYRIVEPKLRSDQLGAQYGKQLTEDNAWLDELTDEDITTIWSSILTTRNLPAPAHLLQDSGANITKKNEIAPFNQTANDCTDVPESYWMAAERGSTSTSIVQATRDFLYRNMFEETRALHKLRNPRKYRRHRKRRKHRKEAVVSSHEVVLTDEVDSGEEDSDSDTSRSAHIPATHFPTDDTVPLKTEVVISTDYFVDGHACGDNQKVVANSIDKATIERDPTLTDDEKCFGEREADIINSYFLPSAVQPLVDPDLYVVRPASTHFDIRLTNRSSYLPHSDCLKITPSIASLSRETAIPIIESPSFLSSNEEHLMQIPGIPPIQPHQHRSIFNIDLAAPNNVYSKGLHPVLNYKHHRDESRLGNNSTAVTQSNDLLGLDACSLEAWNHLRESRLLQLLDQECTDKSAKESSVSPCDIEVLHGTRVNAVAPASRDPLSSRTSVRERAGHRILRESAPTIEHSHNEQRRMNKPLMDDDLDETLEPLWVHSVKIKSSKLDGTAEPVIRVPDLESKLTQVPRNAGGSFIVHKVNLGTELALETARSEDHGNYRVGSTSPIRPDAHTTAELVGYTKTTALSTGPIAYSPKQSPRFDPLSSRTFVSYEMRNPFVRAGFDYVPTTAVLSDAQTNAPKGLPTEHFSPIKVISPEKVRQEQPQGQHRQSLVIDLSSMGFPRPSSTLTTADVDVDININAALPTTNDKLAHDENSKPNLGASPYHKSRGPEEISMAAMQAESRGLFAKIRAGAYKIPATKEVSSLNATETQLQSAQAASINAALNSIRDPLLVTDQLTSPRTRAYTYKETVLPALDANTSLKTGSAAKYELDQQILARALAYATCTTSSDPVDKASPQSQMLPYLGPTAEKNIFDTLNRQLLEADEKNSKFERKLDQSAQKMIYNARMDTSDQAKSDNISEAATTKNTLGNLLGMELAVTALGTPQRRVNERLQLSDFEKIIHIRESTIKARAAIEAKKGQRPVYVPIPPTANLPPRRAAIRIARVQAPEPEPAVDSKRKRIPKPKPNAFITQEEEEELCFVRVLEEEEDDSILGNTLLIESNALRELFVPIILDQLNLPLGCVARDLNEAIEAVRARRVSLHFANTKCLFEYVLISFADILYGNVGEHSEKYKSEVLVEQRMHEFLLDFKRKNNKVDDTQSLLQVKWSDTYKHHMHNTLDCVLDIQSSACVKHTIVYGVPENLPMEIRELWTKAMRDCNIDCILTGELTLNQLQDYIHSNMNTL